MQEWTGSFPNWAYNIVRMPGIRYIFNSVLDILMPRTCVVCGRKLLVNEQHLCMYCEDDIPFTYNWNMHHNPMADKYNALIQKDIDSSDKTLEVLQAERIRYEYAAALFIYGADAGYKHICHRLKYEGDTAIGRHFGCLLGKRLAQSGLYKDVDAIIPVPLHWTRKWKRGYNQAEVIAKAAAKEIGAPVVTGMLARKRKTSTQTKLDVEHKYRNVSGAFEVRKRPDPKIRHILLIDDVFTTGATMASCYSALRKAFPPETRISASALASVWQ